MQPSAADYAWSASKDVKRENDRIKEEIQKLSDRIATLEQYVKAIHPLMKELSEKPWTLQK